MKLLFVIDMQEVTVGENHAKMFHYEENLMARVNARIEEYPPEHVIYIRNLMKKNLINKLAPVQVYDGTHEAELADGLRVVSEHIFKKYQGDAFTNNELERFVAEQAPKEIEMVGVDGGGCVGLTAIGAASRGYQVSVNQNCVGTIMTKQEKKLRRKMERMGIKYLSFRKL